MTSGVDAFLVPYGDRLVRFAAPEPSPIASRRPNVGAALRLILGHMGAPDRQLLAAYFLERWPQRRIGAVLRISQQAVSMRLARSLGRLRRLLLVAVALGPKCPQCGGPRPFPERAARQWRCAGCAQRARWTDYTPKTAAERMRAYRARKRAA